MNLSIFIAAVFAVTSVQGAVLGSFSPKKLELFGLKSASNAVHQAKSAAIRNNVKSEAPAQVSLPVFPAPSLPADKASYNFAVDIINSAPLSNLQCLYNQGYKAIFSQIYGPSNGGSVNQIGCQNVINAYSANLGTEVYVTPALGSSKSGSQQFDEAYNGMKNAGINIRSMWLQVTAPINWPNSISSNVNFIQSFIQRAQAYGVTPGIYTNWYDWQQITGAYVGFANTARLWYWNALGQGPNAETIAAFDDFRTFGGWTQANVKQFALNEALCSLTLNRDVYPVGAKTGQENGQDKMIQHKDLKQPTAGGFV